MRLKITPLLFNIVIIAYLISNCGNSPMDVANKGQLQMRISFAEEINKASTLRETAVIDRMTVTVFNSNGVVIDSTDLTQSGTTWQGSIELDPANNLTVMVDAFENSLLSYSGSRSGVNIQAGQNELTIFIDSLAPTACFMVTPLDSGDRNTTFSFDASCSSDPRDASAQLQMRWDFENDGTFDTQFSTATHQYSTVGQKTIRLEVINTGGLTRETTHTINVAERHDIFNIELSPPSPDSLLFNEFVFVDSQYYTDDPAGVRVFVVPFSGGARTQNSVLSSSPLYAVGSGMATGFFTVTGVASVDSVEIKMLNDQNEILHLVFVPVAYEYVPQ